MSIWMLLIFFGLFFGLFIMLFPFSAEYKHRVVIWLLAMVATLLMVASVFSFLSLATVQRPGQVEQIIEGSVATVVNRTETSSFMIAWWPIILGIPILIALLLGKRSRIVAAMLILPLCLVISWRGTSVKTRSTLMPSTSVGEAINSYPSISETPRITEHGSSLDALWEKLTESQIDLTNESPGEDGPILDPNDKEATEAVAKTFGLDADGELPPVWVITPPKAIGNVYRQSIASGPYSTVEECRQRLETEELPQAVCRRIEQVASGEAGYPVKVASPLPLGIGLDYIFRQLCVDEFTGTVDSSVGEMKNVHVLMEFNDSVDRELRHAWLDHERRTRLQSFGLYAGILIAALAAVYGLLRVDTWTRGYYSKQLLWGSAIAIIAVAFLLVK